MEVKPNMPNAKVLSEKQAIVAQLTEKIQNATVGVIVDYKGINVEEDTALRRDCREGGVDYAVIKNTLLMSVYSLIISIPAPVILALLFNEIRTKKLKVSMQAISYAPNFISTVVMVSMITMFLTPQTGFVDSILRVFGYSSDQSIINEPSAFYHLYVWSGIWQGVGWSSVIYSAAIEGVPVDMYEAAWLDGASKIKQIWYVTLPTISPTIIILAIMAIGNVLNIGYEKVFLMQTDLNLTTSEIISTYVYKAGLQQAQYSFSTMVGLFNNVINFAVLVIANSIAKRVSETSLW